MRWNRIGLLLIEECSLGDSYMKSVMMLLPFVWIIIGCSTSSVIPDAQPTGDNTKDIYLQEWVTSYNITFCEKILDVENYLDGYFCLETMTNNKYYIPLEDWKKHDLDFLFLRVSKAQVRAKLDKDKVLKDYLCSGNSNVDCADLGTPHTMPEIQQWKE